MEAARRQGITRRRRQRETHFGWAINAQQLASRSQPASKDRFKRVGRCVPPCSAVFWVPWGRKRAFEKPILFQTGKVEAKPTDLHLYVHQMQAIAKAQSQQSYVVTTGTGSGKSLAFFIPIIDRILKAKQGDPTPRTRAIIIYPMNALANSQLEELDKFLYGYSSGQEPFTVKRYTGQESSEERKAIADNPPDILLTNFMMLELILTRFEDVDRRVVDHCRGLEFLVLDELHTYRGRQGADVAMLVRRIRERLQADKLVCIGTSATMSSTDREDDRNKTVADVASVLFGAHVTANDVIGETLERVTNPARDVIAFDWHLPSWRLPQK